MEGTSWSIKATGGSAILNKHKPEIYRYGAGIAFILTPDKRKNEASSRYGLLNKETAQCRGKKEALMNSQRMK